MYTIVIPRHKKTRLQDEILRLIIENGEQSSTTILNNFKNTEFEEVERTSIVRTLSKLTIDEKISITNFEKKSGGKGRIFNLAKKEFKKIIEDTKHKEAVSSELFWKHLSPNNYSIQEITEISNLFDERMLKIDQPHVIPQSFLEKINDKDIHDYSSKTTKNPLEDRMGTIPPILKIISKSKPMTLSQILQKLKNIDILDIQILIDEGLITENQTRYDLTHLGLLELFFLIFRDANLDLYYNRHPNLIKRNDSDPKPISFEDWDKSKDPQAKKIVKELDSLRLKYVDLLPNIFKKNNFKKLGITFSKVVALLLRLYKNLDYLPEIETKIMSNVQFNALQRLDNIRQDFYHNKIREHLDISGETRHMIQRNKNTRSLYWLYDNLDETEEPKLNQILNDRIQKKITFDFYSICKAYCSDLNTRPSKIRKWHDQEIRTLLDFSKNYIKNIELSLQ